MDRTARRQMARIALVVAVLAAVGEAGHQLLQRTGWVAAHHAFHLAYGIGAVAAFVAYAVRDIARNGLPRFSWSLRPVAEPLKSRD